MFLLKAVLDLASTWNNMVSRSCMIYPVLDPNWYEYPSSLHVQGVVQF